jgi:hypothetical protein
MDLRKQVAALFLGDAPHEDAVGATAVEIPFYHCVSLSHPDNALSRCLIFRKVIIFQVVPDLRDPCIGTFLRNWAWLPEVSGTLKGAHDPWRAPRMERRRDRQLRGASPTPFAQVGRLGGRLQQTSLEDAPRHGCLGRCARGECISCCVAFAWNMLQFQHNEVLLEPLHMNEVGRELGVVAATLPPDLPDDELGVPFDQELSDPQGQSRRKSED